MTSSSQYEISPDAEEDWQSILSYTYEHFGATQVQLYSDQLAKCLDKLVKRELPSKKITLDELEVLSIHCQHHFIFGMERKGQAVLILAILHERMDFIQRLKNRL